MVTIDSRRPLVHGDRNPTPTLDYLSSSSSHTTHPSSAESPHSFRNPGVAITMNGGAAGHRQPHDDGVDFLERGTLCISRPKPNYILHRGDDGFREELGTWYSAAENNATERLVRLKTRLKSATTDDFWTLATEGIAELAGAQFGFISKRMLVDDEDSAVEMPPFGQQGSCLMAQAFYFNDGHGNVGNPKNMKYFVYGCPCEHMKHDKTLVIPERLSDVIPNNPNSSSFVVPAEGYLALPLTEGNRCFAHFGVMWSQEGLEKRQLSFAFLEMMLHSLEDVILDGFLARGRFSKSVKANSRPNAVIPHEAVTATQSLKPYARSLSHELRTPMQGVVGMLDVMYATVREAVEGQNDARVKSVLETLRENIEVVQDSSRRAVEAADNVVHAYDMNMGVPDTPTSPELDDEMEDYHLSRGRDRRPDIVVTGDNIPIFNLLTGKRRRDVDEDGRVSAKKKRRYIDAPPHPLSQVSQNAINHQQLAATSGPNNLDVETNIEATVHADCSTGSTPDQFATPGLRHTNLRDVLQFLVNDLLKVGGRPESAIANETDGGEEIEVRVKQPQGDENIKLVRWTVDGNVPDTIVIDEKDLAKMISCVFLNAVKFTEEGSINLHAYLKPTSRYIIISVADTGPGIPEAFRPNLFKPFSKEDDSLTRQSEGLGLGLLVARGLARKLGGDLICVRSETSGPNRGTQFEMRIPITPGDCVSRPGTPFGSPSPSHRSRSVHSAELEVPRPPSQRISPTSNPSKVLSSPKKPASRTPPRGLLNWGSAKGSVRSTPPKDLFDRSLAEKHPLTFLVVEDNKINRKLLVSMLNKMGYRDIYEAYDGADAVRKMEDNRKYSLAPELASLIDGGQGHNNCSRRPSVQIAAQKPVDVVLMDLWMPYMDGYEASERILAMDFGYLSTLSSPEAVQAADPMGVVPNEAKRPTILAVTADATDGALEQAAKAGMKGFLTKPYKLRDLERLILEYCATAQPSQAGLE